ncbi:MAG: cation diffusion facilitator family transporter [Sphingomonadales bacterium]
MGRAAKASVFVATILIFVKGIAWFLTGSVSLLGSLIDSILDLVASLVNFFAVKTSLEPPDDDHRFGHGKAEPIAGLLQSSVILGSAVFLVFESISRLLKPIQIENSMIGIWVSLFAILITFALVLYQRHVVRETGSVVIEADSLHYTGDLLMNAAVIAALYISSMVEYNWVDGVFGIAIAIYIAVTAVNIFKTSIDMLMDKEFSKEDREKIFNLVLGNEDVKGMHDLKTRRSGLLSFIQMHVELEPTLSLQEAHAIADEVEATVGEVFPNTEILIHTDPLGAEGHFHGADEL